MHLIFLNNAKHWDSSFCFPYTVNITPECNTRYLWVRCSCPSTTQSVSIWWSEEGSQQSVVQSYWDVEKVIVKRRKKKGLFICCPGAFRSYHMTFNHDTVQKKIRLFSQIQINISNQISDCAGMLCEMQEITNWCTSCRFSKWATISRKMYSTIRPCCSVWQ